MPAGTVVFFDQFLVNCLDMTNVGHDFGAGNSNVLFCALVTSAAALTSATPNPHWGGSGITNLALFQVASGGNYVAGGNTLGHGSVSLVGGACHIDFADPAVWVQDALNPTNAAYGVIYDTGTFSKKCIGFVDLGGSYNMRDGSLSISWGAPVAILDNP